jgi:hypothetical protein
VAALGFYKQKMISRRGFIEALLATGVAASTRTFATSAIDRSALVTRHNPRLTKIDPLSPLSLGNGEFAFTADVTGLQTFPRLYADAMPLCTMSQWGWHTRPMPASLRSQTLRPALYETHGRKVGYNTSSEGQTELFNWLRENPHRLHLGQIGLEIDPANITEINQELDLWRGVLRSQFKLSGDPVSVTTAVHPERDLLAVVIDSRFRLVVRIAFPYGSPSLQAADWNESDKHQTRIIADEKDRTVIERKLDGDGYYVTIEGARLKVESKHALVLTAHEFVLAFSRHRQEETLPTAAETIAASARSWKQFWTHGAAVELAESKDKRAIELERRIVLSQYLTAIQCSGSMPPQETG